jgi:hypothetical protein
MSLFLGKCLVLKQGAFVRVRSLFTARDERGVGSKLSKEIHDRSVTPQPAVTPADSAQACLRRPRRDAFQERRKAQLFLSSREGRSWNGQV